MPSTVLLGCPPGGIWPSWRGSPACIAPGVPCGIWPGCDAIGPDGGPCIAACGPGGVPYGWLYPCAPMIPCGCCDGAVWPIGSADCADIDATGPDARIAACWPLAAAIGGA